MGLLRYPAVWGEIGVLRVSVRLVKSNSNTRVSFAFAVCWSDCLVGTSSSSSPQEKGELEIGERRLQQRNGSILWCGPSLAVGFKIFCAGASRIRGCLVSGGWVVVDG